MSDDQEEHLARHVESVLDGWMSYSDLWKFHRIKRGWLDVLVRSGKVRYKQSTVTTFYDVMMVFRCLAKDPKQEKTRYLRG